MNFRAVLAISLVAIGSHAFAADNKIHILSAAYGDPKAKKTCVPDLSKCEGTTQCEVEVSDSLCKLPEGAEPMVLLVTFQCDKGPNKNVAAYPGQTLKLIKCP